MEGGEVILAKIIGNGCLTHSLWRCYFKEELNGENQWPAIKVSDKKQEEKIAVVKILKQKWALHI